MGTNWKLLLLLGSHFAWVLSFPLWGPLLGRLAESAQLAYHVGVAFILASAITFLLAPLTLSRLEKHGHRVPFYCGLILIVLNLLLFVVPSRYLLSVAALSGATSASIILSWFIWLMTSTKPQERTLVIVGAMIFANVVLHLLTLAEPHLSLTMLGTASSIILLGSLATVPRNLRLATESYELDALSNVRLDDSVFTSFLAFIFIFYFAASSTIDLVYSGIAEPVLDQMTAYALLPYILVLALIAWQVKRVGVLLPLFGSVCLGLSLVAIWISETLIMEHFLSVTLVMAAFAFVDIFLWVALANQQVSLSAAITNFGRAIAANLTAISFGSIILRSVSTNYLVNVGISIMLTFVVLIPLYNYITRNTITLERSRSQQKNVKEQTELAIECVQELADRQGEKLTAREREVFELLIAGLSNEQIAEKLFVSLPTVRSHLRNIYRKTGFENRRALLAHIIANTGK